MTIVIINRWSDNFCDYNKLIDTQDNQIIYITDNNGSKYVETYASTSPNFYVENLRHYPSLFSTFHRINKIYGKVDLIIAMSEYDIAAAGKLRTDFNITGMNYETAKNFTDKTCMKKNLINSGIKFPQYGNLVDLNKIDASYPLIIKPKDGNSSVGVYKVDNGKQLDNVIKLIENQKRNYEFEEYIDGDIFHVDGYISHNNLIFCKPSQYINKPLDYEVQKKPLGSQLILDENFDNKVFLFTQKILNQLKLSDGVFHLEFIQKDKTFYFLEVGARQGGGEIVPMFKKVFSIDLIHIFLDTQLLKEIDVIPHQNYDSGAYLLFPVPKESPSRVLNVTKIENIKTIDYQISPKIGDILNEDGGYYFNSGRFLFVGNKDDISQDILETMSQFSIETEKI